MSSSSSSPPAEKLKHHHHLASTLSLTTTNGLVSAAIFIITALVYIMRRDDAQWRARVPYEALLSRLERDDSVERIPLPPQYLPMLPGTNTPDAAALRAAMLDVTRCNRVENQSPRCDCIMEAFNDKMGFATLTDANKVQRHIAFAAASDSCMLLRGTFVVSVDDDPTTTFDILILWWAVAVMAHLSHAFNNTADTLWKWTMILISGIVYVMAALALLLSQDKAVTHILLITFLGPLFDAVIYLVSWITHMSRPSSNYSWKSVLGDNPQEILVVCVGLPCALRLQLLFLGRNELVENWFALYLALFAAFCSMLVRLLRYSAMELATPGSQDPDSTTHKVAVEDARRAIFLAAKWTWAICMGTALSLLLMYSAPANTQLATPVLAARAAVLCFVIIFALQIPMRSYKHMPIAASQQPLILHVCEFAARAFLMVIMWYYLLG